MFESAYYQERYAKGEWRAPIFMDMIRSELPALARPRTFLDIGCGAGFDDEPQFQEELAQQADRIIGIEPDEHTPVADVFDTVYRSAFEDAPIQPGSVDLAWSVMVLEHLEDPSRFFEKLYHVLRPGGVFYGFTVDSRHYFVKLARLFSRFGINELYLRWLHTRGADEFRHYPTRYLCNRPQDVDRCARDFSTIEMVSLSKAGQVAFYLPRMLRFPFYVIDRLRMSLRRPGAVLVMRIQK